MMGNQSFDWCERVYCSKEFWWRGYSTKILSAHCCHERRDAARRSRYLSYYVRVSIGVDSCDFTVRNLPFTTQKNVRFVQWFFFTLINSWLDCFKKITYSKPDVRNKFYLGRNRHPCDKNPCFFLFLDYWLLFFFCPGDAVPQFLFRSFEEKTIIIW